MDKYEDHKKDLFSQQIIREPEKPFYGTNGETGNGQGEPKGYPGRTSPEDVQENQVKEPKGNFNGTAKQLDLFEYQAAQLPKIRVPGKLRTKQEVSTTRIRRVDLAGSGYVIQRPQDAATLLSHLVLEPQKETYFLSRDEDGKVLEVIRHAIGVSTKFRNSNKKQRVPGTIKKIDENSIKPNTSMCSFRQKYTFVKLQDHC